MFIFEPYSMRCLPLVILLALSGSSWSQTWYTKANLADSLKVQTPGGWTSLRGSTKATSAWLVVDATRYRGDYLVVESSEPLAFFVEGNLLESDARQICWPVDSISRIFGKQKLWLNLYHPKGYLPDVQIYVRSSLSVPVYPETDLRPVQSYRDFLLAALVITLAILLGMLRVNRLFVISYLNVSSLLSFREGGDHPMYNRVTNTTNILLLILVAFVYSVLRVQPEASGVALTEIGYGCFRQTVAFGMLLLTKGLVIFLFSAMFNISAWKGLQYIGFVRYLLLLGLALLGIQVAGVFIFSSFSFNLTVNRYFVWILGISWLMLVWGKLRFQTRLSAIHLFSYLCATEIGPILLTATANWKV